MDRKAEHPVVEKERVFVVRHLSFWVRPIVKTSSRTLRSLETRRIIIPPRPSASHPSCSRDFALASRFGYGLIWLVSFRNNSPSRLEHSDPVSRSTTGVSLIRGYEARTEELVVWAFLVTTAAGLTLLAGIQSDRGHPSPSSARCADAMPCTARENTQQSQLGKMNRSKVSRKSASFVRSAAPSLGPRQMGPRFVSSTRYHADGASTHLTFPVGSIHWTEDKKGRASPRWIYTSPRRMLHSLGDVLSGAIGDQAFRFCLHRVDVRGDALEDLHRSAGKI